MSAAATQVARAAVMPAARGFPRRADCGGGTHPVERSPSRIGAPHLEPPETK
jgi:hypothetical protein